MKRTAIGFAVGALTGSGAIWLAVVVPERTWHARDLDEVRSKFESGAEIDKLTLRSEYAERFRELERERDGIVLELERLRDAPERSQTNASGARNQAQPGPIASGQSASGSSLDELGSLIDRVGELGKKAKAATDPFVELKDNWRALGGSWNKRH
ncbi:MAG: hypothetical protein IT454_10690 [Planctomycetes bacterium]|nr:hypothetical protein [Planctomycetota bacterium]